MHHADTQTKHYDVEAHFSLFDSTQAYHKRNNRRRCSYVNTSAEVKEAARKGTDTHITIFVYNGSVSLVALMFIISV